MAVRLKRRSVYLATIVAMVSVAAGFAMAATVNIHSQATQGDFTTVSSGVPGVTYASLVLAPVPNPAPVASTGTNTGPQTLANGANAFCASPTCTTGDPAEVVTYNFVSPFAGAVQLSVTVAATAGGGTTILYLGAPTTVTSGTIVLYWDTGMTATTINSVSVVVQQCSTSSSCP